MLIPIDTNRAHTKLQRSLDKCALWSIQNKLTANSKKTKIICFTASKKKLYSLDINLSLNDVKLQLIPSYKYLGITLDPHLKYDIDIRYMLQSVVQNLHVSWYERVYDSRYLVKGVQIHGASLF